MVQKTRRWARQTRIAHRDGTLNYVVGGFWPLRLRHLLLPLLCILFPLELAAADVESASSADWPTFMADSERSGKSRSDIRPPLVLSWTHTLPHAPLPSWPPPAQRDPYNQKPKLHARVTFDRVSHVVGLSSRTDPVEGHVYFCTTADSSVACLNLRDGNEVWRRTLEGPIRCAPSFVDNTVVVGSDDGCVYALDRMTGKQLWRQRVAPLDERLPGNQRIVSRWPVRTSVTLYGGVGYVGAGLFPVEGVFYAMLDLADGRIIDRTPVEQSLQGYPIAKAGRLVMPTGRDPRGAVLDGQLNVHETEDPQFPFETTEEAFPYSIVGTARYRFGGADGRVAAVDQSTGRVCWSAPVDGKPYGLAIVGRCLLVSTDVGKVYCFRDARNASKRTTESVVARPTQTGVSDTWSKATTHAAQRLVDRVRSATVSKRGYVLLVGTHAGVSAIRLAQQTKYQVIGVEVLPGRADLARERVHQANLGDRVSIHCLAAETLASGSLPYVAECFNVVVVATDDKAAQLPAISTETIRRVIRPYSGVGMIGTDTDSRTINKVAPVGAGQWSHAYADGGNSGSSNDTLVTSDLTMQWYGPPGPRHMVDRHQRNAPPLFVEGRLFVPGDNYVYAVDAYNGTILWERPVPEMRRLAMLKSSGNMAATATRLFVASGTDCLCLDAESGALVHRHAASGVDGGADWGYVGVTDDVLVGSVTVKGAQQWLIHRDSWKIAYEDGHRIVVSQGLIADEQGSGKRRWTYQAGPDAVILNPTIAHDGRTIYFVECESAKAARVANGRPSLPEVFAAQNQLVAIDVTSGDVRYRKTLDLASFQHVIHMSVSGGRVLVTGSKNVPNEVPVDEANESQLWYELHCYDAATGRPAWKQQHLAVRQVISGIHGEQMQRPVIVNAERIHLETTAYDLVSGDVLWEAPRPVGGGCGTLSCSSTLGFRRLNSTPHAFDLRTGATQAVTKTTRPGCWINMLPAGGLLMIPESSSGCSCQHGIQTSLVMRAAQ